MDSSGREVQHLHRDDAEETNGLLGTRSPTWVLVHSSRLNHMFLPDCPNLEYIAIHRDDAEETNGLLGTTAMRHRVARSPTRLYYKKG